MAQYDLAIADHSVAITLDSNEPILYNNRGNAYRDSGNFEEAIADYTKAIALKPNYAKAYEGRAKTYMFMHDIVNAEKDLARARLAGLGLLK